MITTILSFIPGWLVFAALLVAGVHRLTVVIRFGWTSISPWENVIAALSVLNGAAFYLGLELGWLEGAHAILFSRFVFIWIATWSLYISHSMANRLKPTKDENDY